MKNQIIGLAIRLGLCISLAAMILPWLYAEERCPGDVTRITPRFVRSSLIVIPVKINQAGPFDFIVDTGSQITVVDPSLATKLGLTPQGTVGLVSAASYAHVSVTVIRSLEIASHVVENPAVIIKDLAPFREADFHIRGVLGQNFLSHFDLMIDYRHKLLCMGESREMREVVQGERIPLARPQHPENEIPFSERLVIPVQLPGYHMRQVLLILDSGSDCAVLYASREKTKLWLPKSAIPEERGMSKAQQAFAPLQPQKVRIGSRTLSHISFLTPVGVAMEMPEREEDGLLPTVLFQRIYFNFADRYVVFDPW
jgi:predicted aspartyl protease